MSHYPAHIRRAFLDWIDAGCPPAPLLEHNYSPVATPSPDLARRMTTCTDVVPKDQARRVAVLLGYAENAAPDVAGMTYATAASALLLATHGDFGAARTFLERARPRHRFGTDPEDWWDNLDEPTRERYLDAALDSRSIADDLARMLADAGVIVVWAGFEGHPWRAMWPRDVVALLSLKRLAVAGGADDPQEG